MNHEGYRDETADRAVAKVRKQTITGPEPAAVLRNQKTIDAIRAVADAAGMTIIGRIWLRDNETEWVFK